MSEVTTLTEAYQQLQNLQFGNSGAVVGALDTDPFMDSLYVPDRVDERAREFLDVSDPSGELFVITGSAGDGKSAIFARAYNQAKVNGTEWLQEEHINLDATTAKRRDQGKLENLESFLTNVQEDLETGDGPRRGLAMNLGIALNFFEKSTYNDDGQFDAIWEAVRAARDPNNLDDAGIFESEEVVVANLSYRPLFRTDPDALGEGLLREIVDRFDYQNEESPLASVNTLPEDPHEALVDEDRPYFEHNLIAFALPEVREAYAEFLAGYSLARGEYINPRQVLYYLSSALIPEALQKLVTEVGIEAGPTDAVTHDVSPEDPLFWNAMYDPVDRRKTESKLDPCAAQSQSVDEQILSFTDGYSSNEPPISCPGTTEMEGLARARTWVRYAHLLDGINAETLTSDDIFVRFASSVAFLDSRESPSDRNLLGSKTSVGFEKVVAALQAWSGHDSDTGWVKLTDGQESNRYQFFAEWRDNLEPDDDRSREKTTEETRPGTFWFVFDNGVEIPLTFRLYHLMELIARGYNPNAIDLEGSEGVRLIRSQMSKFTKKANSMEIRMGNGAPLYHLDREGFTDRITVESLTVNDD